MHVLEVLEARREEVRVRVHVHVHHGAASRGEAAPQRGLELVGVRDALAVRAHGLGEAVPGDLAELGVDGARGAGRTEGGPERLAQGLELPAGTLEPGEELETAARRELAEETGYTAERWRSLGYLFASPGVLDEKLHLFVAEGLTAGASRPEADEDLEAVTVTLADAVRMCLAGEIKDAKTVTALLLWERMTRPG